MGGGGASGDEERGEGEGGEGGWSRRAISAKRIAYGAHGVIVQGTPSRARNSAAGMKESLAVVPRRQAAREDMGVGPCSRERELKSVGVWMDSRVRLRCLWAWIRVGCWGKGGIRYGRRMFASKATRAKRRMARRPWRIECRCKALWNRLEGGPIVVQMSWASSVLC